MTEFNGSHLINLFKELNVEIGHLNPAVIHGWFDTDCPDTRKLLNWMCSSLSKENYVSAQQIQEYNEIYCPLEGEDYTEAVNQLEKNYPNIRETELNNLDIHLLEQEIELLEDEEQKADELIESHENININLTKELYQANSECYESSLSCKKAQKECTEKSKELDRLNEVQHEKILIYGKHLDDFEVRTISNFLNNADVNERVNKFETVINSLKGSLKDYETSAQINITSNSHCEKEIKSPITIQYDRIYNAREKCLKLDSEVHRLAGSLCYLNRFLESKLPFSEWKVLSKCNDSMKEQINSIIKQISETLTDNSFNERKLPYAEKELETNEEAQIKLQSISKQLDKLLSHYYVLLALFKEESSAICSSNDFLRKIYSYISKNLHSSSNRSTSMSTSTEDFNKFLTTAKDTEKFQFVKNLINLIRDDTSKECSLEECVAIVSTFKSKLDYKVKQVLIDSLTPRRTGIFHNVNVLRKFLTSGPTSRILIMPPLLGEALTTLNGHITNQNAAIKSAVDTTKKIPLPHWEKIRRQLWIYYLTEPEKLFSVIKELEQEKKEGPKKLALPQSSFRDTSVLHSVSFFHK